jgi:hypothetical protein
MHRAGGRCTPRPAELLGPHGRFGGRVAYVAKLFLPQSVLEEWALGDKADIKDGKLVVNAEKASFLVTPAVHFAKLVSGTDDRKLAAKVKTQQEVQDLGVEQMMDSAILGESAYEIVTGYLAEVPTVQGQKGADKRKVSPESDLLASYLLDKL